MLLRLVALADLQHHGCLPSAPEAPDGLGGVCTPTGVPGVIGFALLPWAILWMDGGWENQSGQTPVSPRLTPIELPTLTYNGCLV